MNRIKLTLLALLVGVVGILTPSVASASPVQQLSSVQVAQLAKAGTWTAAKMWIHTNQQGEASNSWIVFNNVGQCDAAGYLVYLDTWQHWAAQISSLTVTNANGCNSTRLYRCVTGETQDFYGVTNLNFPAKFNDQTCYIRFFRR